METLAKTCAYCHGTGEVNIGHQPYIENGMIIDEVNEMRMCLCQVGECDCEVCEDNKTK